MIRLEMVVAATNERRYFLSMAETERAVREGIAEFGEGEAAVSRRGGS